jgi:hypothetical protein
LAPDGHLPHEADVIFCSNTIEHLPLWREKLSELARGARRHVVVLAPFDEFPLLEPEHVASFEFGTLPARLEGGLKLVHHAVVSTTELEGSRWVGKQFMAVWSRPEAIAACRSEGGDHSIGDLDALDLRDVPVDAIPHCLRLARGDYKKFDRMRADLDQAVRSTQSLLQQIGLGEVAGAGEITRLIAVASEQLLQKDAALKSAEAQLATVYESVAAELTGRRSEAQAAREELARMVAAIEQHNAALAERERILQISFDTLRQSYNTVTSMNSFRYMMRVLERYGRMRGIRIALPAVPERMRIELGRLDPADPAASTTRPAAAPRLRPVSIIDTSNENRPPSVAGLDLSEGARRPRSRHAS